MFRVQHLLILYILDNNYFIIILINRINNTVGDAIYTTFQYIYKDNYKIMNCDVYDKFHIFIFLNIDMIY